MLNSKASLEANQAALNRIMRFANFFESQQQNLVACDDELSTLFNRVNDYNNVIVSHYHYTYPVLVLL
jgi:hypothetical protein